MYPFITLFSGSNKIMIPTFFVVIVLVAIFLLYFTQYRINKYFSLYFTKITGVNFTKRNLYDIILLIMVCSFVGARLFHILYEHPRFYFENPKEILYFWKGGFVFFGGFFLSLFASLLYFAIIAKKKFLKLFFTAGDFLAPSFSLGYAFGRIGCFLEGCCFGRFCDWPWAIQLRHPTQLYAMTFELLNYFIIRKLETQFRDRPGRIFILWVFLHSSGRLLTESFRADFRGAAYYGLSISSWISIGLMLISALWLQSLLSDTKKN